MRNLTILAALGLAAAAGSANAGVTSTVTLTNDYDFRGITQTDEDPAIQASVDFATDSGWYIGAWASNVDFPGYDGDIELDLYTGFTGSTGEGGLTWDAGLIWYTYPTSDGDDVSSEIPDFPEIYGSLAYGMFKGKLWYSNDFGGTDESSFYLDTSVTVPLPANFSILGHVGYSDGDAIDILYGDSYTDYSVGVGYAAGKFSLALKFVGTDGVDDSLGLDDSRAVFTIATTFPWAE
jgi:uncharacterized protein (TIGR02001 family)